MGRPLTDEYFDQVSKVFGIVKCAALQVRGVRPRLTYTCRLIVLKTGEVLVKEGKYYYDSIHQAKQACLTHLSEIEKTRM